MWLDRKRSQKLERFFRLKVGVDIAIFCLNENDYSFWQRLRWCRNASITVIVIYQIFRNDRRTCLLSSSPASISPRLTAAVRSRCRFFLLVFFSVFNIKIWYSLQYLQPSREHEPGAAVDTAVQFIKKARGPSRDDDPSFPWSYLRRRRMYMPRSAFTRWLRVCTRTYISRYVDFVGVIRIEFGSRRYPSAPMYAPVRYIRRYITATVWVRFVRVKQFYTRLIVVALVFRSAPNTRSAIF